MTNQPGNGGRSPAEQPAEEEIRGLLRRLLRLLATAVAERLRLGLATATPSGRASPFQQVEGGTTVAPDRWTDSADRRESLEDRLKQQGNGQERLVGGPEG
jgi:hypothetical protein